MSSFKKYYLITSGFIVLIALGVFLVNQNYINTVYPLQLSRGYLVHLQGISDPKAIQDDITQAQDTLPDSDNPWFFLSTAGDDLEMMQKSLQSMLSKTNQMALFFTNTPSDTKLLEIHAEATEMVFNLSDIERYVYVTPMFVFANLMWITGFIGISSITSRKFFQ